MRSLVIYDTNYGNTKRIAELIAKVLGSKIESVTSVSGNDLHNIDLLVVGSPINGWMPTNRMGNFLGKLEDKQLFGTKIAAFDTRVKLFIHGDAAGKINRILEHVGARSITAPIGFFVKGEKGPLLSGEAEKAKKWAQLLKEAAV